MKNIIILDSGPYIRYRIKQALDPSLYEVFGAGTFSELQIIVNQLNTNVDLIIMDTDLKQEDGYDILKYIRTKYKNVPVMVLTSLNTKDQVIRSYMLGADDYFLKPFDENSLLKRVQQELIKNNEKRLFENEDKKQVNPLENEAYNKKKTKNYVIMVGTFNKVLEIEKDIKADFLEDTDYIYKIVKNVSQGAKGIYKVGIQRYVIVYENNSLELDSMVISTKMAIEISLKKEYTLKEYLVKSAGVMLMGEFSFDKAVAYLESELK